ncbi:MAG: nitrous oxide reductase family maturation protein NosD [Rhodospirillaceae bacterium]
MLRKLLSKETSRDCGRACRLPVAVIALLAGGPAPVHAAELNVGPGRALGSLQAGVAAAKPNDRIVLDAGVYLDDVVTIDKPLIIEGGGRGATLRATKPISNRKGLLVVNADVTVRKITFEGANVTDEDGKNGAGIRHQAGRLTVDTCVFNNNQNGILANGNKDAFVTIRRSTFSGNGAGDGYTHGIYVNAIAHLSVSDSVFTGTKIGHDIKSRALKTTVTNTVLDDGVTGTPSYAVDLPNGGEAVLKNVRVTQGPRTSNNTMIAYGAEKSLHEFSSLTITGSSFVNRASNATAVNNFTAITATLNDNTFENVGEIAKGPVRMNRSFTPSLREGAVFSGADPSAISYFRIHNTGTRAGSVNIGLYDSRDGRFLGTWFSPSIAPNAAPQYSIRDLEAALQIGNRPATYSAVISAGMTGTFQHVLHRAAHGVLTNLSTCTAGVARAGGQIAGVHSSNLDNGYPASIVVQNQGATPGAALIGLYDARDGRRVGAYTTPEVPVDGELMLNVRQIENAARISPPWEAGHWVLKIENEFAGALQQVIANQGAGLITDMTTVCLLDGVDAAGRPSSEIGVVFPASGDFESVLRVYNPSTRTAPIHVDVFDAVSGSRLRHWDSMNIAPNTSRLFSIADMLTSGDVLPQVLRLRVQSDFQGLIQHLVRHTARGTSTNLSSCDAATTASARDAIAVRASAIEEENVALLVIYNAGTGAASAELRVFDALDGRDLGGFATDEVPAGGNIALSVVDIEKGLGLPAHSGIGAYNVRLKESFEGVMQYLLVSVRTGAVNDMTTACALAPSAD